VKTILLVEDVAFSRLAMARVMRAIEDYTVIEVENGEQALEKIANYSAIDIIIADIMIPPPNGLELLKLVRTGQTAVARDIPFITISGAMLDDVQNALNALDVTGAIAKPATKAELTAMLGRIEAGKNTSDQVLRSVAEYEAVEISELLEMNAFDRSPMVDITKNPNTLAAFLGAVPILDGLSRHELDLLGETAMMLHLPGNAIIDGGAFGTSSLPVITMGAAEYIQETRLSDGEIVEHRVAHLEAGNLLGTFNFMSPPKDFVHPKVRTIRATDVVVLKFNEANPDSELGRVRTKIELAIGRILAQRVTYSDKVLAMTLTNQLAETRTKRTAGSYVIMTFVLLAIYTLTMRSMLDAEFTGAGRSISSVVLILVFLLPFIAILKSGTIKASDLGFTLRGARAATIDAVLWSIAFIGVLIGLKYIIVNLVPEFSDQAMIGMSRDFTRFKPDGGIDWSFYALNIMVYALFVPVQEVITRCGLQSLLVETMYGSDSRRALVAIISSNFVFAAAHAHLNVGFALATFVGGLFFGWLFYRHRSIVGVSIAHFLIGATALFALGLEEFLR
jgi:CheY-like chemotaxis protein/membrane protease YdiL (CAAX protease family)